MADTDSSTDRPLSLDERRLQVAALTVLLDRVKAAEGQARKDLHAAMKNGESHTVWSPAREDQQIATVNRSKPKPTTSVTDPDAFDAWVAAEYPEAVTVTRSATAEGLEFLADAAPELVDERHTIAEWARSAALKRALSKTDPVTLPGVEVHTAPAGRLSVRLADDAYQLVAELIERGYIDLQGTPLAIES